MPIPIVECVPNFSEGTRLEIIDSIADAIQNVNGIYLLDRHTDIDHNRSVITFIGTPPQVEEAAFQAISTASKLIDLRQHNGVHPRIGATDVVPFIPVYDVSMKKCIDMAQHVGKRVGDTLGIPVYLYEEAASRPDRKSLENIRRGQYEGLINEIGTNPDRKPDYGPTILGPAGACAIGARNYLIAFNVYLTTGDITIAKSIAKSVRFSSGGLRNVKALGLLVGGLAQVSMNLTNFKETPIERVVELIRREATRYGVAIHHSELVGLIPQAAIARASSWYLQLDNFSEDQILEQRINSIISDLYKKTDHLIPDDLLHQLSLGTATPGGGAAAAFTGAIAAALVTMVARLTSGRKKYINVESKMQSILGKSEELMKDLSLKVNEDAEAFNSFMKFKGKSADNIIGSTLQELLTIETHNITQVQLNIGELAIEVMALAVQVVSEGNINAIADAANAAVLARSAFSCANINVRSNLSNFLSLEEASYFRDKITELENKSITLNIELMQILKERGNLALPL